jgi:cyclophilin family peptidyl-prolyl cis-trans isomerase
MSTRVPKCGRNGLVIPTLLFLFICSIVILASACGREGNDAPADSSDVKTGVKPVPDSEVAVIDTDYGPIVVELYSNVAPKMVERFKRLINEGVYNGTAFHRVNPSLGIIQGGDPLSKDDDPSNDGTGDSQYPDLPAEFSDIPFDRGIVGAARKGGGFGMSEKQAQDTANAQFFITLIRVPGFDKNYTVFGRVIQGIGNADIIAGAPTEAGSERPAEKIVIKSITLQPRSDLHAGEAARQRIE